MASLLTLTFSQPTLTLKPGEVLIKEGDPGGDLFVLESGSLTVERDGVVLATVSSPGALVGEMSVLLGTENTATVRAEKAATLRVVRDALAYLERQPLVALRVAMLLSQRLDATSALLVEAERDNKSKPQAPVFGRLFAAVTGAHDREHKG
ncbi:MAG: cyclic nucleotide-binding domain-containing protein [Hyphomicrobiales bacterium]|nr:MAG: cyclic nucleotide-binding domain-containing protein [Hyphomicrobiales bacterium]